jgi:hypothetical protein
VDLFDFRGVRDRAHRLPQPPMKWASVGRPFLTRKNLGHSAFTGEQCVAVPPDGGQGHGHEYPRIVRLCIRPEWIDELPVEKHRPEEAAPGLVEDRRDQ